MMEKKGKEFYEKFETLRAELKSSGSVEEIADAGGPITSTWSGNGGFTREGIYPPAANSFRTLNVSADFGTTVGWTLIDGRTFSQDNASDSSSIMLIREGAK